MNRACRPIVRAVCLLFVLVLPLACYAKGKETKVAAKDVPAAVMNAFHSAYPSAKIKETTTEAEEGKTYFEIRSKDGDLFREVSYLADGTVTEVKEAVTEAALPATVKAAVEAKYPGAKIGRAAKVVRDAVTTYDLKIVSGKMKMKLVVDPDGKIISEKESDGKHEKAPAAKGAY